MLKVAREGRGSRRECHVSQSLEAAEIRGTVGRAWGEDLRPVPSCVCLLLCAPCKGSLASANANGENAVSGKCSLINNIIPYQPVTSRIPLPYAPAQDI